MRICLTAVLAVLTLLGCMLGCDEPPVAPGRGVVLVILDTARADHFSAYGYSRETTPHFDRLAREGERYTQAYSQSPWTLPSIATILTGLPPHRHGAGRGASGIFPLYGDVGTLAERLSTAEYRTAAFMNVVWCDPGSGLARGFEHYDFATTDASNKGQRDAVAVTDAALGWLRGLERESFFVVLHYFDPHLTYDPPPPFDTRFEDGEEGRIAPGFGSADEVYAVRSGEISLDDASRASLISRYDGELAFVDAQFGRLRDALERSGRWEDSLVIVVADHGEEFWDHGGFEHGHTHYGELLNVPLIVRRPGTETGTVRRERVRQIDIAPTVMDFAGLDRDGDLPGEPLGGDGAPFSVAEGSLWGGDLVSVRSDSGTLILDRASGVQTFFAAGDDGETRPLPYGTSGADETLLEILRTLPAERRQQDDTWEPTDEQLERLKSLGYLR
jgi:arylsulfatase A-like enzyme